MLAVLMAWRWRACAVVQAKDMDDRGTPQTFFHLLEAGAVNLRALNYDKVTMLDIRAAEVQAKEIHDYPGDKGRCRHAQNPETGHRDHGLPAFLQRLNDARQWDDENPAHTLKRCVFPRDHGMRVITDATPRHASIFGCFRV